MNPLFMCKAGLTVGLKLRSQGHTQAQSADTDSPVPCGTRRWIGTQHRASGWHIWTAEIECSLLSARIKGVELSCEIDYTISFWS